MVVHRQFWECETCGTTYRSEEAATSCENQQPPDLSAYPIGLIYGDHSKGAFYEDITFAIGNKYVRGHGVTVDPWVARDNGAGDSLEKLETVGTDFYSSRDHDRPALYFDGSSLNPAQPGLKRMAESLRARGIEPTVFIDGVVRPISEIWPKL
jgi:hypothetical protein